MEGGAPLLPQLKERESGARWKVSLAKVSSGCPCPPSQLQAQVAALSQEVTRLQKQRERSLEKESSRVNVVRPYPCQVAHLLAWPRSGSSGPGLCPRVGHGFSGPCPDPFSASSRLSTPPLRPTAQDRPRAGLRRHS